MRNALILQLFAFLGHLSFLLYVHSRFPTAEHFTAVWKRFGEMFMYDLWFAVYFIFYFISIYLAVKLDDAANAASRTEQCVQGAEDMISTSRMSVTVAFAFVIVMPIVVSCTLCTAWSNRSANAPPPPYAAGNIGAQRSGAYESFFSTLAANRTRQDERRQPMV